MLWFVFLFCFELFECGKNSMFPNCILRTPSIIYYYVYCIYCWGFRTCFVSRQRNVRWNSICWQIYCFLHSDSIITVIPILNAYCENRILEVPIVLCKYMKTRSNFNGNIRRFMFWSGFRLEHFCLRTSESSVSKRHPTNNRDGWWPFSRIFRHVCDYPLPKATSNLRSPRGII